MNKSNFNRQLRAKAGAILNFYVRHAEPKHSTIGDQPKRTIKMLGNPYFLASTLAPLQKDTGCTLFKNKN